MAIEKGRGATLNGESRRFNLPERLADGDWLDALEQGKDPVPRRRTEVTVELFCPHRVGRLVTPEETGHARR